MSATTVHVKNISPSTSEKEVKDFFSFCGKIASIDIKPAGQTQEATVTFQKSTAAKTALLLDNTKLGATQVQVSSPSGSSEDDGSHESPHTERDSDEITQEEKPRSRIIAEYLAHGYVVTDQATQRAIDLDNKHGVSARFLATLQNLDNKYHATDKAKSVDQSYGVTQKTNSLWSGLTSYYEKAAGTPTGQKLVNFYTQTSRQVQDIHAEARRLADLKKQEASSKTCKCGSNSKDCSCPPGACTCATGSEVKDAGSGKTTCNCGSDPAKCPCEPGQCACKSCPKADTKPSFDDKTTCGCGGDGNKCTCPSGQCACQGCSK